MSSNDLEWLKLRFSWLTSERVQLMPSLAELALLRLILRCGKAGSIPANVEECLLLIGKADMTREAVEIALREFEPHPTAGGRLIHVRTLRDRADTVEKVERIRELRRKSGKKGGEANGKQTGSKTEANASGLLKQEPEQTGSKTEANAEAKPKHLLDSGVEWSGVEWSNTKGNKTSLEASHVPSAGDAACSSAEASASPVAPAVRGRPSNHAEAVALCRAQMVDAPTEFIVAKFDALEAIDWRDTTGRNEVAHFAAYVRAAWRNQKQQDSDRAAAAPAPVDEALCEEVRAIWNEVAAKKGLTRSRVAPGVATKRAICAAFAGFKRGDSPPGDEEASKRFRLGTFRILFSALGEDPASNGTKGKPVDLEYAVSARGINYAAERANV